MSQVLVRDQIIVKMGQTTANEIIKSNNNVGLIILKSTTLSKT